MLILVSLPYESNLNLENEIENLNQEHNLKAKRIEIPVFSGVSLENIIKYEETIEKMNMTVIDLSKKFIRKSGGEFNEKDLKICWSKHKRSLNNTFTIDTCLNLLSEDIEKIRSKFQEKESQHTRILKDFEEAQRRTKGSLLEMDLSVILGEKAEYEFLKEVFVLVDVEEIEKFKKLIENTASLSEEAIEIIASDDKHVLYKAVVIKNMEKDLKKILKENFIIKENNKIEGKTPFEKIKQYEETKNDLQIFIDTHKDEVFNLMVHTNLLKLFIESIYRYGLPIKYLYFVCKEEKDTLNKLRSIGENWESERMVGDDEYSMQDEQDLNIAKAFIGFRE
jgi:V-type H+-transporting ATPase subunit C